MPETTYKPLQSVSFLKLMLILGIIAIHSNITLYTPPDYSHAGIDIVEFIISLAHVCVPSFFIISGYLFFYKVKHFSFNIYRDKLTRRIRTLFIPYILWNLFCAGLFLFKVTILNFPGLGIIENGIINWPKFFVGFIFIEQAYGSPYAFTFWFIRNLIVFVILTPVVWLVARKWWSVALFLIIIITFNLNVFGIEWFILGAACGLNHISFDHNPRQNKALLPVFGAIYLLLSVITVYYNLPSVTNFLLFILEVAAAFCFLYSVAQRFTKSHNGKLVKVLYSAAFFIYAFHQCFCTITIKFWLHIFGCKSIFSSLASFFASFLTLLFISLIAYLFLKKTTPSFLNIITGDRS